MLHSHSFDQMRNLSETLTACFGYPLKIFILRLFSQHFTVWAECPLNFQPIFSSFDRNWNDGLLTVRNVSPYWNLSNAKRSRFFHQQPRKSFRLDLVNYDAKPVTRSVLLHVNGRYSHVPCTLGEQLLNRMPDYFSGYIVKIRLEDHHVIMRMRIPN